MVTANQFMFESIILFLVVEKILVVSRLLFFHSGHKWRCRDLVRGERASCPRGPRFGNPRSNIACAPNIRALWVRARTLARAGLGLPIVARAAMGAYPQQNS